MTSHIMLLVPSNRFTRQALCDPKTFQFQIWKCYVVLSPQFSRTGWLNTKGLSAYFPDSPLSTMEGYSEHIRLNGMSIEYGLCSVIAADSNDMRCAVVRKASCTLLGMPESSPNKMPVNPKRCSAGIAKAFGSFGNSDPVLVAVVPG